MPKWITVDANDLEINERRAGQYEGVEIFTGPAPDDVPEKLRLQADDDRRYVVFFKYLTPSTEPRILIRGGQFEDATLVVGGRSGRVYKLSVPGPAGRVKERIESTLKLLSRDRRYRKGHRLYKAVREAVSDNADALLEE